MNRVTRPITKYDDVIDSRDIIDRISTLAEEAESLAEDGQVPDDDEVDELAALKAFAEECEGYLADWHHGESLIRDSYFEEYAEELAYDVGAIRRDEHYSWPLSCINWRQAARELQQDYTSFEFDGVTYWARA